jgi:hypothetical protein
MYTHIYTYTYTYTYTHTYTHTRIHIHVHTWLLSFTSVYGFNDCIKIPTSFLGDIFQ